MWKSLLKIALAAALAAGCKEAGVDRPADKSSDDTTANATGRTGKVDLGRQRPTLPSDQGEAATPTEGAGYQPGEARSEDLDERRRQRIAPYDLDGDGKISDDERKAARARRAEDLHKNADTDGDGKVTPDELANSRFRRLDPGALDLDKNGEISVQEIESALQQRNRAWGGNRFRDRLGPGFKRPQAGSGSAAPR